MHDDDDGENVSCGHVSNSHKKEITFHRQHSMLIPGKLLVAAFAVNSMVDAFTTQPLQPLKKSLAKNASCHGLFMVDDTEERGCQQIAVPFDGVPTEAARKLDHRQA